jgi:hypothetical protein
MISYIRKGNYFFRGCAELLISCVKAIPLRLFISLSIFLFGFIGLFWLSGLVYKQSWQPKNSPHFILYVDSISMPEFIVSHEIEGQRLTTIIRIVDIDNLKKGSHLHIESDEEIVSASISGFRELNIEKLSDRPIMPWKVELRNEDLITLKNINGVIALEYENVGEYLSPFRKSLFVSGGFKEYLPLLRRSSPNWKSSPKIKAYIKLERGYRSVFSEPEPSHYDLHINRTYSYNFVENGYQIELDYEKIGSRKQESVLLIVLSTLLGIGITMIVEISVRYFDERGKNKKMKSNKANSADTKRP